MQSHEVRRLQNGLVLAVPQFDVVDRLEIRVEHRVENRIENRVEADDILLGLAEAAEGVGELGRAMDRRLGPLMAMRDLEQLLAVGRTWNIRENEWPLGGNDEREAFVNEMESWRARLQEVKGMHFRLLEEHRRLFAMQLQRAEEHEELRRVLEERMADDMRVNRFNYARLAENRRRVQDELTALETAFQQQNDQLNDQLGPIMDQLYTGLRISPREAAVAQ